VKVSPFTRQERKAAYPGLYETRTENIISRFTRKVRKYDVSTFRSKRINASQRIRENNRKSKQASIEDEKNKEVTIVLWLNLKYSQTGDNRANALEVLRPADISYLVLQYDI
jgi:hypothetical protein